MMLRKIKEEVKKLKRETVPIYYALLDKRTPLLAKILAGLTIGYLLSPIDLIPDFIPVVGLLDDLIIVPVLIRLTIKLIPKGIIQEIKAKMKGNEKLTKRWYYAIPIVMVYGYLLIVIFQQALKWLG